MNIVYTVIADEADGWIDRAEVRERLDDLLRGPVSVDPETWGEGPDAEAGIDALLSMAP